MMPHYKATNKVDGTVVEYDAPAPDFVTYPESEWRTERMEEAFIAPDAPVDTRMYGGRRELSKIEFIALLGDPAYKAILNLAKQSVDVEAWVKMFELATPDDQGNSIHLDSPLMQAGIPAIEAALIAVGAVTAGWAQEVLNG